MANQICIECLHVAVVADGFSTWCCFVCERIQAARSFELFISAADGSDREGPYPVDFHPQAGWERDDLRAVAALAVGESYRIGGGAAPIFETVRVS